jgi:signal transduction histidine kinase
MHVRIGLPQHFMVTAMNVVRTHLTQALPDEAHARHRLAIHRVLDLDLAIMLHTYRQELEARQVRAERLATFGQLVGSIGHELRNPLGVIETSLYVLKSRNDPDPKLGKHLDRIGQQVTIANDIITQLLDLIRDRPLARQRVSLDETFSGLATALARPEAVVVSFPPQTGAFVSGDPIQLRQVFFNLVDNATHAAAPTGRVEVQVGRSTQGMVDVTVDDSGPGIDRAIAARLFEPLVTTKPKGIGLGLALVKRIVDRHQGTIEVSRGPLGGARFTVRLHEVTP